MAADDLSPPEDDDRERPIRSGEASADDAELKAHLAFEGDQSAMELVDGLAERQGTGPAADPGFREELRVRLVAETDKGGGADKEG
ncbi:MAG TPA: hypothetical protein VJM32_02640 [Candidatus Saccharimonadales bacterium]|nr:hypothetical protein [Candidatus Saccharimonadales bacterium]